MGNAGRVSAFAHVRLSGSSFYGLRYFWPILLVALGLFAMSGAQAQVSKFVDYKKTEFLRGGPSRLNTNRATISGTLPG